MTDVSFNFESLHFSPIMPFLAGDPTDKHIPDKLRMQRTPLDIKQQQSTHPISSRPTVILESVANLFAYWSSIMALHPRTPQSKCVCERERKYTHRSVQKFLSSSIVLPAPLILANSTSTPASPRPQNALQKSMEGSLPFSPYPRSDGGECARAKREREVAEGWRRADMLRIRRWRCRSRDTGLVRQVVPDKTVLYYRRS